jgi:hypothetical protein
LPPPLWPEAAAVKKWDGNHRTLYGVCCWSTDIEKRPPKNPALRGRLNIGIRNMGIAHLPIRVYYRFKGQRER